MLKWQHVFFIALIIAVLGQGMIWRQDDFTDEDLWLQRVEQLRVDLRHPTALNAWNPVYSGHPGMAAVSVAALGRELGLQATTALRFGVVVLNFVSITGAALLAWRIRPDSRWWLALAIILTAHPLYVHANPTNAVITPMVVLMVLAAWHGSGWWLAFGLGAGMATRIPTAPLIGGGMLLYLWRNWGWKKVVLVGAGAGVVMVALDPLWWWQPMQHVLFMLFRSSLNFTEAVAAIDLGPYDFVLGAPLALVAMCLGLLQRHPGVPNSMPTRFTVHLFLVTIAASMLFLTVTAQSLRHFMPLIVLWECLLPLFVWDMVPRGKSGATLGLAGAQVFLLLYALL